MYKIPQQNFHCFVTMNELITSVILPRNQCIRWKSPDQWLHNIKPKSTVIFNITRQKKNIEPYNSNVNSDFQFSYLHSKLLNRLFEFFREYGVFQFPCSFKRGNRRYPKKLRQLNSNRCWWTSTWSRILTDSQRTEKSCSPPVNKTVFSFILVC